jgi:hypothetical protein
VPVNERGRLEIGQESVVLHQSTHQFVLLRPCGDALGKLDALVIDRAPCFGTEKLPRVLLAECAKQRPRDDIHEAFRAISCNLICLELLRAEQSFSSFLLARRAAVRAFCVPA